MRKILSLLLIPIFTFIFFLLSHQPVQSDPCEITFDNSASAGSQIHIQVLGAPSTPYLALLLDNEGNIALPEASNMTDGSGNAIISFTAPLTPGSYTIGVRQGSIGGPGAGTVCYSTSGTYTINIATNVGSCSGFLGCLGGISVKDLKFTNYATFIEELISSILPIILGVIGFITVIIIIISGIQFITSSGNPEAAAAARSRLTLAIVGFVIVVLAFAITQIIDKIFLGGSGVF